MAHKVHPKAYRIKEITDWNSRGYYREPLKYLEEDFRIREFLKKKIGKLGVEKIEIERFPGKLNIIIFSARPGLIIGRGGEEIERLKKELEQSVLKKIKTVKKIEKKKKEGKKKKEEGGPAFVQPSGTPEDKAGEIKLEIKEIKDFWTSANLSAQWVAQQIEKRMPFRRVLKQALSKILAHKEVKGARVEVAGRLNGAEMARREWVSSGKLPRQTIRAEIDYAKAEAYCSYGVIGVKVWIYKGERFD